MWALLLKRTPMLAWHGMQNGPQKNTCYDEIGLCYQNIDVIMGFMAAILHYEEAYLLN